MRLGRTIVASGKSSRTACSPPAFVRSYLAEAQRLSHAGSWAGIPKTGEHTYWSEEAFRVLGFDPAEQPPRFEELQQRFHPDDRARTTEHFTRAIRDKAEFDVSYRIVHPGGEIREIQSIGHPVIGPTGDVVEVVGTVMDVTERRRAEEERQLGIAPCV